MLCNPIKCVLDLLHRRLIRQETHDHVHRELLKLRAIDLHLSSKIDNYDGTLELVDLSENTIDICHYRNAQNV